MATGAILGEECFTKALRHGIRRILGARDVVELQFFASDDVAEEVSSQVDVALPFVVLCVDGALYGGFIVHVQHGYGAVMVRAERLDQPVEEDSVLRRGCRGVELGFAATLRSAVLSAGSP